jgi:hypothetical protein
LFTIATGERHTQHDHSGQPTTTSLPNTTVSEPITSTSEPTTPVVDAQALAALQHLLGGLSADDVKVLVKSELDGTSSALMDVVGDAVAQLQEDIAAHVAAITAPIRITVDHVTASGTSSVTINGAHPLLPEVLAWVQAKRHPFLIGPAGCGKTTLAEQLAESLGLPFYTDGQLSNEYQLLGFVDAAGNYHTTPLRQTVEHGGVYLADEFDGWDETAALALHQVTSNGHMTFPDSPEPVAKHPDCVIILAGNTWGTGADREYVGRNQMDAATLSRIISLPMDYDKGIERAIAGDDTELLFMVWKIRDNIRRLAMRHMCGTRELSHAVAGIAAGLDRSKVIATVIRRDLSDSDWAKVTA